MDVSGKDFSLTFRGFEHNDPETVERFTAFCEANFALSPETVRLIHNSPDTIVLTHGGSVEELEALAKVLREIGAVVDVSADTPHDIPSLVGGPSTQELHRLFGGQSASENDDTPNSCPYPPPLGRSLYLLSNSEAFVDRRALRQRARQTSARAPEAITQPTRGNSPIITFSWLAVVVGLMVVVSAMALMRKEGLLAGANRAPSTTIAQRADAARRDPPRVESSPARTLQGSLSHDRFLVEMKALASASAVSISSLTFTPTGRDSAPNGILIRRIVGEPTFLKEPTPGTWLGPIVLSVFIERNGESSHFTVPATISVQVSSSGSARATLQVEQTPSRDSTVAASVSDTNSYTLSGVGYLQVPLS